MSNPTNPFQQAAELAGQPWPPTISEGCISIANIDDPKIVAKAIALESWTPPFAAALLSGWLPKDEAQAARLAFGDPSSAEPYAKAGDPDVMACLERLAASTPQSIPRVKSAIPGQVDRLDALRTIEWSVRLADEGLVPFPPPILMSLAKRRSQNADALRLELDQARKKIAELEASQKAINVRYANTAFAVNLGLAVCLASYGKEKHADVAENLRALMKSHKDPDLDYFHSTVLKEAIDASDHRLIAMLKAGEDLFSQKTGLAKKLRRRRGGDASGSNSN